MSVPENRLIRAIAVIGVVVVLAGVWVSVGAQGLGPSSAGSLAELTAEVRQLRLSIQETGRSHTQIQALSISLTAQQSRLTQVGNRLNSLTDQLDNAAEKTQKLGQALAEAQAVAARSSGADQIDAQTLIRRLKAEYDPALAEENAIRTRQIEAHNAFRAEEARWVELVAKLDEILKR